MPAILKTLFIFPCANTLVLTADQGTTTTTTTTKMPAVLHYFGIPGRGEAIRGAIAVAGVDYEDKRMSFPEFGASSFKSLPVYQVSEENPRALHGTRV